MSCADSSRAHRGGLATSPQPVPQVSEAVEIHADAHEVAGQLRDSAPGSLPLSSGAAGRCFRVTVGVDFAAHISIASENALVAQNGSAQAATTAVKGRTAARGLSDLRFRDILTHKNIKINNTNDQEPT